MKKKYTIGVYRNAGSGWHGGQIYFDNLITLLRDGDGEPVNVVIIEKERPPAAEEDESRVSSAVYLSDYLSEERSKNRDRREEAKQRRKKWWQRILPQTAPSPSAAKPVSAAFEAIVRDYQLDFVFPLPPTACGNGVNGAGWIPDLQHCYLPELFDSTEIKSRDEMFGKLSEAGIVVFSSETCLSEFLGLYPAPAAKLRVWSFCSNPGNDLISTSPLKAVEKYCLPEQFFLVANQFWKHKDHAVVVEALSRLKREGLSVPVVFTGALRDYRGSGHVDDFLQAIQRAGLNDSVHLLGFLDRDEQLHLMRSALAVIQPSRFEGWSTVVEDCKALGQRLILTDLTVHCEQAPPDSIYFPMGDAAALSEEIRTLFLDHAAEWLKGREAREFLAKKELSEVRAASRRRFLEIVEASQATDHEPTQKSRS